MAVTLALALAFALDPGRAAGGTAAVAPPAAADSAAMAPGVPVEAPAAAAVVPPKAPGGQPDYVAEIRAAFTPDHRAYARQRTVLAVVGPLFSIAVSLLLLFTGAAARMRDFAHRRFRHRYGRALVVVALLTLAVTAIELPLAWYRGFWLEHRHGLSTQSFASWFADQWKEAGFGVALYGLTGLVALGYLAIERFPRRWWVAFGLGTLPVVLAGAFLQPLVFDPLFNDFTRLRDRELEARIVALAAKAGIPARRVFEVDKSRQTVKYNAYVAGFGASQRIVLWDTTVKGMEDDEILFVVGHEIGHYRLGHIGRGIALFAAASFALFFVVRRLMVMAVARFGRRWGIGHVHDLATLPLLIGCLTLAGFVAQPLANAWSRAIERESDFYALEITRDNDAGARAFVKLGGQNRSDPEPSRAVEILLYTHPPLVERVRRAMQYRPWEEGRPARYFRPAR